MSAAALGLFALEGFARGKDLPMSELRSLGASLKGKLLLPADAGFDAARRVASFNPTTDARPLLIVQAAEASDVQRAIDFARNASLELAVKSGGHDVLGESTVAGGLLIDLSTMDDIKVAPQSRSARVGSGVRNGRFAAAASQYDLAPVLGCNPAVGVAGLTLGGGLGWFLGTKGAACDNLLSVEIVTADGRILTTRAEENPELFWALKGGGGNFGVVTNFEYRLHPLRNVVAGAIGFRSALGPFLRFYRGFMADAPDALAVELNISAGGDLPLIIAIACFSGDRDEGVRALAPLKTFGRAQFGDIGEVAYGAFAGPWPDRLPAYLDWRGLSFPGLEDTTIAALETALATAPPGWNIGVGHYMHGEICRIDPASTPLQRRAGEISLFIGAGWEDPHAADASMVWVAHATRTLKRLASPATYINYLSDDSEGAVRASYGEANYARLQRIKRSFDPDNIFHRNRNIRPAP